MAQEVTESDLQFEDALHALTDDERKEKCNEDFIDFEPIPPELAIRFRVKRVLKCYNALNLVRWIITGLYPHNGQKRVRNAAPAEPTTKISFTPPQLERLYTFVRNIMESQRDRLDSDDRTLLNRIDYELDRISRGVPEEVKEENDRNDISIPRFASRNAIRNIVQSLESDCGLVVPEDDVKRSVQDFRMRYYPDRPITAYVQSRIDALPEMFKAERLDEVREGMTPMIELALRSARSFDLSSPYQQARGGQPRQPFRFTDWWNVFCFLSYDFTLFHVSYSLLHGGRGLSLACNFELTEFMNWVYVQGRFFQRLEEKNPARQVELWRAQVREKCGVNCIYENTLMKPFHLLSGGEARPMVYIPPDDAFKSRPNQPDSLLDRISDAFERSGLQMNYIPEQRRESDSDVDDF
jgi:hypothetical protein